MILSGKPFPHRASVLLFFPTRDEFVDGNVKKKCGPDAVGLMLRRLLDGGDISRESVWMDTAAIVAQLRMTRTPTVTRRHTQHVGTVNTAACNEQRLPPQPFSANFRSLA